MSRLEEIQYQLRILKMYRKHLISLANNNNFDNFENKTKNEDKIKKD